MDLSHFCSLHGPLLPFEPAGHTYRVWCSMLQDEARYCQIHPDHPGLTFEPVLLFFWSLIMLMSRATDDEVLDGCKNQVEDLSHSVFTWLSNLKLSFISKEKHRHQSNIPHCKGENVQAKVCFWRTWTSLNILIFWLQVHIILPTLKHGEGCQLTSVHWSKKEPFEAEGTLPRSRGNPTCKNEN